jgi:hypothetical protein
MDYGHPVLVYRGRPVGVSRLRYALRRFWWRLRGRRPATIRAMSPRAYLIRHTISIPRTDLNGRRRKAMEYNGAVTEQLAEAIRNTSAALEGLLVAYHHNQGVIPTTAPPARPAPYRNDAGRHGVRDAGPYYSQAWGAAR